MAKFVVEQYETHVSKYLVEANSETEAVYKVFGGVEDDSRLVHTNFLELNQELGLPVDLHEDLADDLRDMGIPIGEDIIPSIRAVYPKNRNQNE